MFNFNFLRRKRQVDVLGEAAPARELFVEETPPHAGQPVSEPAVSPTKLTTFLGQDYWMMGRRDGYCTLPRLISQW